MMFLCLLHSVFWYSAVAINGELGCEDPTSLLQRGDVHENVTMIGYAPVAKHIDMEPVLRCLRLTTPSIQTLKYPPDAEEHFEELRKVLSPWLDVAAKKFSPSRKHQYHCWDHYCGPWMENYWIEHFLSTWEKRGPAMDSKKRLADVFGPFIPIFMPYNELLWADELEYDNMVLTLRKSIRPHVAYITVVLRDRGLVSIQGKRENREAMKRIMENIPNVMVLSSGGYGHVPIPLLKQPEDLLQKKIFKSMKEREFLVSYMGSAGHAPDDMRAKMIEIVKKEAKTLGVKVHTGKGSADEWHQVAGNSKVSLCPRGFGRTAFHLFEILQLGLIPIHVYIDTPWLPYPDMYEKIGFSTDLKGLPDLMKKINDMDLQELEHMEEQIHSVQATHFTPDGILNQISLFMKNEGSDLQCRKLPASPLVDHQ